jgi:hypothetical protein
MTITKYGVDHAAVQKLLDSGECQTEEEAIEKVAHAQQAMLSQEGARTGRTQSKVPNLSNGPKSGTIPVSIMDETDLTAETNIERAQLSALGKKGEVKDG